MFVPATGRIYNVHGVTRGEQTGVLGQRPRRDPYKTFNNAALRAARDGQRQTCRNFFHGDAQTALPSRVMPPLCGIMLLFTLSRLPIYLSCLAFLPPSTLLRLPFFYFSLWRRPCCHSVPEAGPFLTGSNLWNEKRKKKRKGSWVKKLERLCFFVLFNFFWFCFTTRS